MLFKGVWNGKRRDKSYLSMITMAILILSGGILQAEPITEKEAENVAQNWAKEVGNKSYVVRQIIDDTVLLKNLKRIDKQGSYVKLIKLKPEGWVLISADDLKFPIIGYSLKSKFDENNLPIQLEAMLESFSEDVNKKRANGDKTEDDTKKMWNELKKDSKNYTIHNKKSKRVSSWRLPLSGSVATSTWGQGQFYNALTPVDGDGPDNHTLTGCTATAMAILMRANSWPNIGEDFHQYTPPGYSLQSVNFGSTNYNWGSMPTGVLSTYNNNIATIMYHAGVAVNMNYGALESGAWPTVTSFENHFRYQTYGERFLRSHFSNNEWHDRIKTDIRQGHPVLYGNHQHTWVIDGFINFFIPWYGELKVFRINYGWNGASNDWYFLDNIANDYNNYQSAIFGIKPNNSNFRDNYEQDNSWSKSTTMTIGSYSSIRQDNHSINPTNDHDWINFVVPYGSDYSSFTIETLNISGGDTTITLYNGSGEQIAFDDDGGWEHLSSKINMPLDSGQYYIEVESYGNYSLVPSYDLRIEYYH